MPDGYSPSGIYSLLQSCCNLVYYRNNAPVVMNLSLCTRLSLCAILRSIIIQ